MYFIIGFSFKGYPQANVFWSHVYEGYVTVSGVNVIKTAINAGYCERTARGVACKLLTKANKS